jgi:TolB-like protein/predicted Ser/Thr protein kinase
MLTEDGSCTKCGAALVADDPKQGCPACLFEEGLTLLAGEGEDMPRAKRQLGDFGDYELEEEIGRGGQGVVYRARQKSLNRTVALKMVGLGPWATEAHLKRFRLEAEAAAGLDHPGIVPIYEVGEREGFCYFSMRLIEGGALDAVVRREPLSIRQAVELTATMARSVHYAHERGVLHRDIKPGNILLDAKGAPHLTDFGLARLVEAESTVTRTAEFLGTPSYIAPEQAGGDESAEPTRATDVYGVGAVFYQLLTGRPPFAGRTAFETVRLVLGTEPRAPRLWNPKVDRDLATICLKCLEKDPGRRYGSALALAEDLERWLRDEPIRARRTGIFARGRKWVRRNATVAALVASLVALVAAVGTMVWKSESARRPMPTGIAVLPFENLSAQKENAYLADGVQDDIVTKLAKIAGLKVISRSSVMQYRGARNTRQIGTALRVSHVLEGSVRRERGRIHLNAQLIDTRTDTHVWAEEFDRDVAEMFALQGEIARKVAEQLHVKISPAEALAIARPPTVDLAAFDLYARAENLLLTTNLNGNGKADLFEAAALLQQATALDPSFFQAYCELAYAHDTLYFFGFDHTPARLARAEAAIAAAFRLRPDAGEAHLTRAGNLYRGYLDYEGALAELAIARRTLPNDHRVFALEGYVERRRGRQEEALVSLERAAELDPRNSFLLEQLAMSYQDLRRYSAAKATLARARAIDPDDLDVQLASANLELIWNADTRPLHQMLDEIRTKNPAAMPSVSDSLLTCALAERDTTAARNALAALGRDTFGNDAVRFPPSFGEGLIARMTNDPSRARAFFLAARVEQEKIVRAQPNYGPPLCVLGLIDAGLGRKEEALREGRRAVALLPREKDASNGAHMIEYLAMIAAWVGEKDLACEQLAVAVRPPIGLSYGQLKLLPFWDPLRGDPRFEKLVASLAP